MTRLVTGGAGFIGGEIVRLAVARGRPVRVLDSMRTDVHPVEPEAVAGVELVRGDVWGW